MFQVKQVLKEFRQPYFRRMQAIWTEDDAVKIIRCCLVKKHRFFGVLPHQRVALAEEFADMLQADPPYGARHKLFFWSGTSNRVRDVVADWVQQNSITEKGQQFLVIDGVKNTILWNYDLPGQSRPRPFDEYLEELESAWYCLCLPGYTGTTHRVLESILRGAIPVIQTEQVPYCNLPLQDGVNAVFVRNQNWPDTICNLARTSVEKRLAMQKNVVKLAGNEASLNALMLKLVENLTGQPI